MRKIPQKIPKNSPRHSLKNSLQDSPKNSPKNSLGEIYIKELNSRKEMMTAYELLQQMYKTDFITYGSQIEEMIRLANFKMIGAFLHNKIIGVCGYWVLLMLYCGRYIQASNLIVDNKYRNLGIGKKLLDYLEKKGRKLKCQKFVLDSSSENKKSHALYYREGFYIRGFHFMKDL